MPIRTYESGSGENTGAGPDYDYPNGSGTEHIDDSGGYGQDQSDQERPEPEVNYSELFGAPDFSSWIRRPRGKVAQEYELKIRSMMKAGVISSLNNQDFPDAAAFLKYGTGISRAGGELAQADSRARGIIDTITTPANPYMLFAMACIPLVAQLVRNHQPQVTEVKKTWKQKRAEAKARREAGLPPVERKTKPRFTIKLGKLHIPVYTPKIPNVFVMFSAQTQTPQRLAYEVFSDNRVIKALQDMGITLRTKEEDANTEGV